MRNGIHERYVELNELVKRRLPVNPRSPAAFETALNHYLRMNPGLVAHDGFRYLNVTEETATTMRAIGLSYVLQSNMLPMDTKFHLVGDAIKYRITFGSDDDVSRSLSEYKRWKAVYLYASEKSDPVWNWGQPVGGLLDRY